VSVAAVVTRYAGSAGEERLQLKWFAAAALVVVATQVASFWTSSAVVSVLGTVGFLGLWTAVGIAVLKYRLYDIDLVISKAVVYGRRATPYEVLSDFTRRIRGAYSSQDVLPQMARVVAAGTGAGRVVVWLRVGSDLRPAAVSGDAAGPGADGSSTPGPDGSAP